MERNEDGFVYDDHRATFIFGQDDEAAAPAPERSATSRPTKRRKVASTKQTTTAGDVSKKAAAAATATARLHRPHHLSGRPLAADFVPLLSGAERPEFAALRYRMFAESWAAIDARIQNVLRHANRSTLEAVASFVREAPGEAPAQIPAALIVTGPNIASQDLLFEQLAESLGGGEAAAGGVGPGRCVRLRAAEAPNLKATLKKIIRDLTKQVSGGGDDDAELAVGKDGRKFLDYDLEALHAHIEPYESKQVIVAFQDSEAFDTGLLSDLITIFNSWRDRIPFTLLFGIATSVELFQARLLKSTSRCLYGAQFDVVQMSSILDSVFKCAVAHAACPLKLGPAFLKSLVERQQSQVAGIQVFNSSLKYAYMCHFYANPLSVLLIQESSPQPEHLEALRNLPSFRAHVEDSVEAGKLEHARSLLEDDSYLAQQRITTLKGTTQWEDSLLRSLALILSTKLSLDDFTTLYTSALADGIDLQSEDSKILESVRRLSPDETASLLQRLKATIASGSPEIGLRGWGNEDEQGLEDLSEMTEQMASLKAVSGTKGKPLRSQYSAQSRALRTTVVAQKVQLSQDESNLTNEDKGFTELLDRLTEFLSLRISCRPAEANFLNELWMYESKSPYKDVFIPRPGTIFERALSRPHDYLACNCCSDVTDGGNSAMLPTTSVLYHLYQETGALVNVADLWTAFYALVGMDDEHEPEPHAETPKMPKSKKPCRNGYDERTALVLFYQGLAELRGMGFVKSTKKRVDHVVRTRFLS